MGEWAATGAIEQLRTGCCGHSVYKLFLLGLWLLDLDLQVVPCVAPMALAANGCQDRAGCGFQEQGCLLPAKLHLVRATKEAWYNCTECEACMEHRCCDPGHGCNVRAQLVLLG